MTIETFYKAGLEKVLTMPLLKLHIIPIPIRNMEKDILKIAGFSAFSKMCFSMIENGIGIRPNA